MSRKINRTAAKHALIETEIEEYSLYYVLRTVYDFKLYFIFLGMGKLSAYEEELVKKGLPELLGSIKKGEEFAHNFEG